MKGEFTLTRPTKAGYQLTFKGIAFGDAISSWDKATDILNWANSLDVIRFHLLNDSPNLLFAVTEEN